VQDIICPPPHRKGRGAISLFRSRNTNDQRTPNPTGEDAVFVDEVNTLHTLAQKLRVERFKNGSIAFERAEARFDIDKSGRPIGVYMREENESHQLVEEFMLLANKTVAEYIGQSKPNEPQRTFVYRIHDEPQEHKLFNLGYIAKQLGYKINFDRKSKNSISKAINKLLESVRGSKAQNIVETLALRCMAKAVYSTQNIGHYGLAFAYYTHFTSPIRRYPDMMVHRLLEHYLAGGSSLSESDFVHKCKHSSAMEQLAADAERASIKYKMTEYMQDKVGCEFDGVISGVSNHGIYVEINEGKIEGMAPYHAFKDDYFYFDEENFRIVGRTTKKTYTLGDAVRIRVVRADMNKRQLDYEVVKK
jgi:ribonuclease R